MDRARSGLFLPLGIIAIGVIVLLANLGVLSSAAVNRLADLWPLLLVILGLQLILNHTLPRQQALVVGLAAAVVIVAGAVAFAVWAPENQFGTQHADASQRLSGVTAGTLDVSYSAASLDIGTGSTGDAMYQVHVDYPAGENPPTISLDQPSGTVAISQNGSFGSFRLFGSNQRHLKITLSSKIPWTIRISGGAANGHLDLRELQLRNFEISGGASNLSAQLGHPKGTIGVHLSGGASNLTLQAPSGTQWRISAAGGVSSVTINGSRSGNVGGGFERQSPRYGGATDRFDIELSGGVSNLDFRTS